VAPQLGEDVPPVTSAASAARLRAAPEITIEHESALIAVVGPFGQALFGLPLRATQLPLGDLQMEKSSFCSAELAC
jgi:hypothetical protein